MKSICFITTVLLAVSLFSQDTFSIVAVDETTGEVGGAGASCIDNVGFPGSNGAIIINELKPGKGAIHTQAYYIPSNQANAANRMDAGDSPQEIITWLVANDVQNDPQRRQYGVVDFDSSGNARSAAFTGANTDDYKGHIEGPNYAIQGNILLGQEILDSMEARFLNTPGSLADKLMAALQGANVPGADTRCLNEGVSSLSAFIRVAKPGDSDGSYFLDLNVPSTAFGVEPIDSLLTLFDEWKATTGIGDPGSEPFEVMVFPNPTGGNITFSIKGVERPETLTLLLFDSVGKLVSEQRFESHRLEIARKNLKTGVLIYELLQNGEALKKGSVVITN